MELHEREFYLYKILSGLHHISVEGRFFVIHPNTATDKYHAAKIYRDIYNSGDSMSLYNNDTIEDYLCERGYWSNSLSLRLRKLEKEIEQSLSSLYEGRANKSLTKRTRANLADFRKERSELLEKRHMYDYLTVEYVSSIAKQKFLIGCSLYEDDVKYWKDYREWDKPDKLLDKIVREVNKEIVPYSAYREIARTEPWRSIWIASKSGSPIFDFPATNMTEQQQFLISWTVRYENLYKHPNCPSEDVIEDDDLLDGWYIIESKKQKEERGEGVLSKIKNPAIANSQEIYILSENEDEREEISNLNNVLTKSILVNRQREIERGGTVREEELSDVKQKLQMQMNRVKNGR